MAVTGTYAIGIEFEGSVTYEQEFSSAANSQSPGVIDTVDLSSGANTITKPTNAVSCTIIPPDNNTTALTLKGVSGDTGILLHTTNPALVSLASGQASFVINAAASVSGVRFIWT